MTDIILSQTQINDVDALLKDVARTIITPRFGHLADDAIRAKSSPTDLVTIVDEEAEAALKRGLSDILPAAGFIGEEEAAADPSIVKKAAGPGTFWIVDPLDGTRNFVKGTPEFATILALVHDGQTVAGWINAVPDDDLYKGYLNGGAFCNDIPIEPIQPPGPKPVGMRSMGWLDATWERRIRPNLKTNVETTANHCSAYAYIALVTGARDFYISSRIHPWDHAAGVLMTTELGGRIVFLDDDNPYAPADSADRPMLGVAAGRDWDAIAAMIAG